MQLDAVGFNETFAELNHTKVDEPVSGWLIRILWENRVFQGSLDNGWQIETVISKHWKPHC
jgi:hypothetical protein